MPARDSFYQLWERAISIDWLKPGVLVYGQQALFIRKLLSRSVEEASSSNLPLTLKAYFLFDVDWVEILDEALSPDMFLFDTKRIFVVYFPEAEEDDPQLADRAYRQFVAGYEDRLQRYFAAPPTGVHLLVVYPGRLKPGSKLLNFFQKVKSASRDNLEFLELKSPSEREIIAWLYEELRKHQKKVSSQTISRLLEVVGTDLVLLTQELEKLILYTGENQVITEEDILAVCSFQKTYSPYAIEEALESGDLEEALLITQKFLADQPEASEVLSYFSNLSRYILSLAQAKVEVEIKKVPVREVFKNLRPQLKEGWSLFDRKLKAFSSCLGNFSQSELDGLVRELGQIDLKLKSSDLEPGVLLETFLVRYFLLKDKKDRKVKNLRSGGLG
jgi:DNA polymerase-3 subunit delta